MPWNQDYHDEYDDSGTSILGSSPAGSAAALRRGSQPVFSQGFRSGQQHHGNLLNGHGTDRQTIEFLQLCEIFPRMDRQLVAEVFEGSDHAFERALEILSELQGPPCDDHEEGAGGEPISLPS